MLGLLAGFFGAMASICAKLAFTKDTELHSKLFGNATLAVAARGIAFLLMFVMNSLMMQCYVKGMRLSTSLMATVQSTAANMVCTVSGYKSKDYFFLSYRRCIFF